MTAPVRARVRVAGVVQGVGFRPFVWSLADRLGLAGFVGNDESGVLLEVEGPPEAVAALVDAVASRPPPLARVDTVAREPLPPTGEQGFAIRASSAAGGPRSAQVPADTATCAACRADIRDLADRRYGYPFTTCTDCGPRYSIVTDVPYDRARTTMAGFPMCERCRSEYDDPRDRRFHAQPISCPECGPVLWLADPSGERLAGPARRAGDVALVLRQAADLLRAGGVLAVKGIGGYHLAVAAGDETAVALLRARKHREQRPFALVVPDLAAARELCRLRPEDERLLAGPEAPIVLAPRADRTGSAVAPSVAPGSPTLGLMLAYTPLHLLLLDAVGGPLVLTSGNVSDEPIAYDDADARARLAGLADGFLTHDRPIRTRVDDSVVRAVATGLSPVRRSRGYVPGAVRLPLRLPRHVLGCGPELKATVCLGKDERAVVSHHLGDLESYETFTSYVDAVAHLSRLLDVRPQVLAHDLHPDYLSTAWALEQDADVLVGVQHHHAHIAACLAENGRTDAVIGVAFDGTGYGTDGTLWGGEFLVADLQEFTRVGHFAPVPLPGGAAAIRAPWRSAASYLLAAFEQVGDEPPVGLAVRSRHAAEWGAVEQLSRSGLGSPLSSSVGRLFDAVAALLGVRDRVAYEGQAAVELEHLAGALADDPWPVAVVAGDDGLVVRGADLVRGAARDLAGGVDARVVARRFHAGVVDATVRTCVALRERHGVQAVALSGGVFQNALLHRGCVEQLQEAGFAVLVHHRVPPNDGGVSLGQVAVAGARDRAGRLR